MSPEEVSHEDHQLAKEERIVKQERKQERKLEKQAKKMARYVVRKYNHGYEEMPAKVRRLPGDLGGDRFVDSETLKRVNSRLAPKGLQVWRKEVGPVVQPYHRFVAYPQPFTDESAKAPSPPISPETTPLPVVEKQLASVGPSQSSPEK